MSIGETEQEKNGLEHNPISVSNLLLKGYMWALPLFMSIYYEDWTPTNLRRLRKREWACMICGGLLFGCVVPFLINTALGTTSFLAVHVWQMNYCNCRDWHTCDQRRSSHKNRAFFLFGLLPSISENSNRLQDCWCCTRNNPLWHFTCLRFPSVPGIFFTFSVPTHELSHSRYNAG